MPAQRKVIRLSAEHGDTCLWDEEGGVDGRDLGLSEELLDRLADWNERYMAPHDEYSEKHFKLRLDGLQLAADLQRTLGYNVDVQFR